MSTSWVLYLRVGFLLLVGAEICRLGLEMSEFHLVLINPKIVVFNTKET
jgi:hypothetical protein